MISELEHEYRFKDFFKNSVDGSLFWDLYTKDKQGNPVHVWITKRPHYCDRGHYMMNISGISGLDQADRFPRYFFSLQEAINHSRAFLLWRLLKIRLTAAMDISQS